jgi:5-hydroxyisourate hydrolase
VAGRPAAAVRLSLTGTAGLVAEGETDADGRCRLFEGSLDPGTYELGFATGEWFARHGVATFYPRVVVTFGVSDPGAHLHVPLLLSPFGYSTYRGS